MKKPKFGIGDEVIVSANSFSLLSEPRRGKIAARFKTLFGWKYYVEFGTYITSISCHRERKLCSTKTSDNQKGLNSKSN